MFGQQGESVVVAFGVFVPAGNAIKLGAVQATAVGIARGIVAIEYLATVLGVSVGDVFVLRCNQCLWTQLPGQRGCHKLSIPDREVTVTTAVLGRHNESVGKRIAQWSGEIGFYAVIVVAARNYFGGPVLGEFWFFGDIVDDTAWFALTIQN